MLSSNGLLFLSRATDALMAAFHPNLFPYRGQLFTARFFPPVRPRYYFHLSVDPIPTRIILRARPTVLAIRNSIQFSLPLNRVKTSFHRQLEKKKKLENVANLAEKFRETFPWPFSTGKSIPSRRASVNIRMEDAASARFNLHR